MNEWMDIDSIRSIETLIDPRDNVIGGEGLVASQGCEGNGVGK